MELIWHACWHPLIEVVLLEKLTLTKKKKKKDQQKPFVSFSQLFVKKKNSNFLIKFIQGKGKWTCLSSSIWTKFYIQKAFKNMRNMNSVCSPTPIFQFCMFHKIGSFGTLYTKYYKWSESSFCMCKTESLETLTFKENQAMFLPVLRKHMLQENSMKAQEFFFCT